MFRKKLLFLAGMIFGLYTALPAGNGTDSYSQEISSPPRRPFLFRSAPLQADTMIINLLNQVNPDSIAATILHLQSYGTRDCMSPQAVQAQNWIRDKLQSYGLSVYTQDFPQPSNSSDNVIATLSGTAFPDEYVVMGAHYDSYSYNSSAPGADDNGSGTAAVMEIARILSQQSFGRSIIFCLFSAEEYGLYGSQAYASGAAAGNMNILGYLNLDMCAYLYGLPIRTNVIGPQTAQALLNFYQQTCSVYLPDFQVTIGGNLPGNSDHYSFNVNGYMGIFPFEDVNHYSPYIHTPDDVFGTSANSMDMAAVFARSVMATAVSMATTIPPPLGLTAMPDVQEIQLNWKNPGVQATEYRIYRNDMNQVYAVTTDTFYTDFSVVTGNLYEYAVTMVAQGNNQESPKSDIVLVKAVGPLPLPYADDFENGDTYWAGVDGWSLTTASYHTAFHSLTDSPQGNYGNGISHTVYLNPFSLAGYGYATVEYQARFNLENGFDYVYLEGSTGDEYQLLASHSGNQATWSLFGADLSAFAGQPYVSLRFRIVSDTSNVADGFYLDDFVINVSPVGLEGPAEDMPESVFCRPNPFNDQTEITFYHAVAGFVSLSVYNSTGQEVAMLCDGFLAPGWHTFVFDGRTLKSGYYFFRLNTGKQLISGKLIRN
ncbi:MAG TPA: M28 family peptidase [Bacteroidales bacterium]|nr:M28 family peptidase [Bacteroidales bacterium]HSA42326.1 M28 family peptidase [Bacteroidales bacterium]